MREYRCSCGKLLFKGDLAISRIEIKCLRCAKISVFEEKDNLQSDPEIIGYITQLNEDGEVISISPDVEKVLGFTPKEVVGKKMFDFVPEENSQALREQYKKLIVTAESFQLKKIGVLDKNRKIVFLERFCTPTYDKEGKVTGFYCVNWQIKKP